MELPKIRVYGEYKNENYGTHTLCVTMGATTVWFSYATPIAFQIGDQPRVVRKNDWGPTTEKHLDWIDGGDREHRVSGETFARLWGMCNLSLDPASL